ncbi:hypothetical protein ACWOA0_05855 [Ignavigranum ruoffiae]|uniref:Phage protein n=1 Tax=Ignavigranum ruoffiae TaxID=89093 RepID=A0A1H9BT80_9LACT|nr:hypothetical protein [Ignavigranum ruoffiae]SEP92069.1 hypothetical protein SAMN04488558_10393 [Ignavigranum ruoffiae]
MIEVLLKEYLDNHLDVPSFFEFEDYMPNSFVLIEKTSGRYSNKLKSSTVAIQSYGKTMYAAALLNEKIKELMDNLVELDEVSGIHLNSDYNFTDIDSKRYRYQAVFDINHY